MYIGLLFWGPFRAKAKCPSDRPDGDDRDDDVYDAEALGNSG